MTCLIGTFSKLELKCRVCLRRIQRADTANLMGTTLLLVRVAFESNLNKYLQDHDARPWRCDFFHILNLAVTGMYTLHRLTSRKFTSRFLVIVSKRINHCFELWKTSLSDSSRLAALSLLFLKLSEMSTRAWGAWESICPGNES